MFSESLGASSRPPTAPHPLDLALAGLSASSRFNWITSLRYSALTARPFLHFLVQAIAVTPQAAGRGERRRGIRVLGIGAARSGRPVGAWPPRADSTQAPVDGRFRRLEETGIEFPFDLPARRKCFSPPVRLGRGYHNSSSACGAASGGGAASDLVRVQSRAGGRAGTPAGKQAAPREARRSGMRALEPPDQPSTCVGPGKAEPAAEQPVLMVQPRLEQKVGLPIRGGRH